MLKTILRAGYYCVNLSKDGIFKFYDIHLLVARAFIPKPDSDEELVVNHIDEDPLNNYVENLEWITFKENINYGTAIIRRSTWVQGFYNGQLVYDIPILSRASEVGLDRRRIGAYLNHGRPYKGIEWKEIVGDEKLALIKKRNGDYTSIRHEYKKDEPQEKTNKLQKRFEQPQIVIGFDSKGNEVLRFSSMREAIKNGYTQYGLCRSAALKSEYKGLYWKFFAT